MKVPKGDVDCEMQLLMQPVSAAQPWLQTMAASHLLLLEDCSVEDRQDPGPCLAHDPGFGLIRRGCPVLPRW